MPLPIVRLGVLVLLGSLGLFGCGGGDCESLCKERVDKQCCDASKCADTPCCPTESDCEDSCVQGEALAEKAECESERDDIYSCQADVDDICKDSVATCQCVNPDDTANANCTVKCSGGKCASEIGDYQNCIRKYCGAHPNSVLCR